MAAPKWTIEGRNWPHAESSRFVNAGGVKWHVQVMGSGPVALLIHGTAGATHSWRTVAPLLADHFTVVAPDLPGHGFTGTLSRPTLPGVATGLAALCAALGLQPSLAIGHSAGAAIAMTLADKQLVPLRAIVGLGGALLPFPGLAGRLFPAMARTLFVNPLTPEIFALSARVPGRIASFMQSSTGSRIDPEGIALYERLLKTSGHIGGALALMASWDLVALEKALPGITLPVLLAHGARDATISPATSRTVAQRMPNATHEILAGLGHLAHEEAPGLHADLIIAFARAHNIIAA